MDLLFFAPLRFMVQFEYRIYINSLYVVYRYIQFNFKKGRLKLIVYLYYYLFVWIE